MEGMQDAPDSSWENRGHAILSRNNPASGLPLLPLISKETCMQMGSKAQRCGTDCLNIHQQAVIGRRTSEQLILSSQVSKEEGQRQGINP